MSSLWTPSGEHRVEGESDPAQVAGQKRADAARPDAERDVAEGDGPDTEVIDEADIEALRHRLAETPAETVLANHCYGLFELAALYLSSDPPQLQESRLAIDAFGLLVEGLGERLGEAAGPLRDALTQIRLGFVQVEAAHRAANGDSGK
jgi:hypothetical protein